MMPHFPPILNAIFCLLVYLSSMPLRLVGQDALATADLSLPNQVLTTKPLEAPAAAIVDWAARAASLPIQGIQGIDDKKKNNAADKSEIEYLLSATHLHFGADGMLETTSWEILRPKSRDAATLASQIVAEWSPWRSEKPVLKARVIAVDGHEKVNDGTGAFEQAASDGVSVLTDDRRLTLLLDGVESDVLVETVVVNRKRALVGNAIGSRIPITNIQPARVHRVIVTSDEGVQPVVSVHGADVRQISPLEKPLGFWRGVEIFDPLPLMVAYEPSAGPDNVSYPMVTAYLPNDWDEVGKAYADAVETAIASGDTLVRSIAQSAAEAVRQGSDLEKVKWCRQRVQQLVRYTGVEFGAQRIYPVPPDTVINRRFGDCKDQSTLMVALLRALDVTAHVMLLDSGTALDIPEDGCVPDFFDHAIVYVDSIDQWFDPSAEVYPVGLLPDVDCGRRALFCDSKRSQLVTTPLGESSQSTSEETLSYRVNFSGGGDVSVQLTSTGRAGVALAAGYKNADDGLRQAWQGFFANVAGSSTVEFLRHGAFDETGYRVEARGAKVQLIDRQFARLEIPWSGVPLFEEFPLAFAPEQDEQSGNWTPLKHRRGAVFFNAGLHAKRVSQIAFPNAMELSRIPEGWQKKFGPIDLTMEVDAVDSPTASVDSDIDWKELVSETEVRSDDWVRSHDRTLRLSFSLKVEPGEMSVRDANDFIDEINRLVATGGGLSGSVFLDWRVAKASNSNKSNEFYRELAEQALRYPALIDPTLFLAANLYEHGFQRDARALAVYYSEFDPSFSIANDLMLAIYGEIAANSFVPWTDFAKTRSFFEGHEMQISEISVPNMLVALLVEKNGMASLDPTQLRKCLETTKAWLALPAGSLSQRTRVNVGYGQLFASLLLHDEEGLDVALASMHPALTEIVRGILLNQPAELTGMTEDQQLSLIRAIWELLVAAQRYDLAIPMEKIYADLKAIKTPIGNIASAKLPTLDSSDPESVARHSLLGLLNADLESINAVALDPVNLSLEELHQCIPLATETWFVRPLSERSRALTEAIVARTPIEQTEISPLHRKVVFKNPYAPADKQDSQVVIAVVKMHEDDEWRYAPWFQSATTRLLKLLQTGRVDVATKEVEDAMPPPPNLLTMFTAKEYAAHEKLWFRTDTSQSYRTDLVVRTSFAYQTKDVASLDAWIESSGLQLSASQSQVLEDARRELWMASKQYDKAYEAAIMQLEKSTSAEKFNALLTILERDKSTDGGLYQDARWQRYVDKLESGKTLLEQHNYFRALLLQGKTEAAFEFGRTQHSKDSPLSEYWANAYLWQSIVVGRTNDELREAHDWVNACRPRTGKEVVAYRHTLACIDAILGRPADALRYFENPIGESEPDDLVRALIFENLGFTDLAAKLFRSTIAIAEQGNSAEIAKQRLQRLLNSPNG